MATTKMPCAVGSGGGGLTGTTTRDKRNITASTTYTPYTIDTLTDILYMEYWYGSNLYGYVVVGVDGTIIENHDNYGGQYGGVQSIVGNVITFKWNSAVQFSFTTIGILEA